MGGGVRYDPTTGRTIYGEGGSGGQSHYYTNPDGSSGYAPPSAAPAAQPAAPANVIPPVDTSVALQPGTAIPGLPDMTKPGAAEQFWTDNASKFTQPGQLDSFLQANGAQLGAPGMGESTAASMLQRYGSGNTPGVSNDAEGAYKYFQSSTPANVNPYYDYAAQSMANGMNKELASRGQYGSSVGLGNLAQGYADINAQRANAQAQYGLQRAQTGGALASAADKSSLNQSQNTQSWENLLANVGNQGEQDALARLGLGGNLSASADSGRLNRLTAGDRAAGAAQDAARTRGQDAFNNEFTFDSFLTGLMGDTYKGETSSDQTNFGQETGLPITSANNDVANAYGDAAQRNDFIKSIISGGTTIAGEEAKKKAKG